MNLRCRQCGARRTWNRWTGPREPRCRSCGSTDLRDDTRNVRRWNGKQLTCHCGLIPYPHREGSKHGDLMCEHHPDFDPWPSETRDAAE